MNTPGKLAAFVAGLVAVFGAALAIGTLTGPVGPVSAGGPATTHGTHDTGPATTPPPPGGLTTTQDGYTLALDRRTVAAGPATTLSFRVLGFEGAPLTVVEEEHEEDLHLLAVRRDLTGYQHVHPDPAADGTWSRRLDLTT